MTSSPWEDKDFAKLSLQGMDERFLPGTQQEVDFLVQELRIKPGEKILDLGCGAGRHCIELAKRGYVCSGLDISESMLAEAKNRAREAGVSVDFRLVDLRSLENSFAEAKVKFDGALCLCESGFGVLGGAEEDIRFLKTINGLLRPGRKLVITCLNGLRRYLRSRDANPKFDYISGVVHWEAPSKESPVLREEERLYIPSEIAMLLQFSGFEEVHIYGSSPGHFGRNQLGIDDIEMMAVAKRGT